MSEGKMTSKFPFSMESLPRQQSFACFTLKLGSVLTGLTVILYSVFAIAQCVAALESLPLHKNDELNSVVTYGLVIAVTIAHAVTLFLSALMLVGALCEKLYLIKPWVIWESIQVTLCILMFMFWITVSMINHFNNNSLLYFIIQFLVILLRVYMLMIVCSFFKQLEEEKGETERLVKLIDSESWYNV